jgi:hypothetical protein
VDVLSLQRRLGLAVAGYLALVILVVTLVPFRFAVPDRIVLTGFTGPGDLVANVGFFWPLGFVLAFAGERRALQLGFLLSVSVEVTQLFLPGRFPSLLDVATNTLGAGLGGATCGLVRSALARRADAGGVLALDLPLAGLLYLFIPLLWLSGLASTGDPSRRWLALVVGLAGVVVLAAIDRHLLAPRRTPRWAMPVGSALWFGLGLLPGWYAEPGFVALASVGAGGLVALLARVLETVEPAGRRYEVPAVRRAGAVLLVFLVLAALWPIGSLTAGWRGGLGLAWPGGAGQVAILRFLELLAGTAVAGYGFAEARGRRPESASRGRATAWVAGGVLAGVLGLLRGFHPAYGASLLEAGLMIVGFRLGVAVYWRQRAYVLALLGRSAPASAAPPEAERRARVRVDPSPDSVAWPIRTRR